MTALEESQIAGAAAVLARVKASLDAMAKAPPMFGGPEALEFQALTLIEMRQLVLRPRAMAADPDETHKAYERFLAELFGEPSNTYLHAVLRAHGQVSDLPGLLHDFARWLEIHYPAEVADTERA